jgi:FixJ family two-component response regulator
MSVGDCVIHVVDDDASWRVSVKRLLSALGYRVALHEDAKVFLDTADLGPPGCVLLDLRMPGLDGLQVQQRLVEMRRRVPIVFVSAHGDIPTSVVAVKSGAEDFLTKPVDTDVLLSAIERAVDRDRAQRAGQEQLAALRARVQALTPAERKVFDRVVRGRLNKQIGIELGTTERTVKWHRHNLMQKLGLQSLAELVSLAERLGLIDEGGGPIDPT